MPLRDRNYLDAMRGMRCIFTGRKGHEDVETVDPAHVGTYGKGIKSSDAHALPVLHSIHLEMHQRGEMTVFRERLPDSVLRDMIRNYAQQRYIDWLNSNENSSS